MTAQTLWYWEAKNNKEREQIKGATLILKILVDSHRTVMNIMENESEENKQYKLWEKYKKKRKDLSVN